MCYDARSMYLGCRFYPFVYVEFSRIPLEKSGLHIFPCTINCQTRVLLSLLLLGSVATMSVGEQNSPHFFASRTAIEAGESTTLSWNADADAAFLSGVGKVNVADEL